jgi:hypothetical protein
MMFESSLNFTHVHMAWNEQFFDPENYDLFVIATRDPLSRVVSAFNWRHPIGGGAPIPADSVGNEADMYTCFPELPGAVNSFAEALGENTTCGRAARRCLNSISADCGHLAKNLAWYVGTGLLRRSEGVLAALRHQPETKHGFAVSVENFDADASALWDWLCVPPGQRPSDVSAHTEYPRGSDTDLSPAARALLTRHTTQERYALEELMTLVEGR